MLVIALNLIAASDLLKQKGGPDAHRFDDLCEPDESFAVAPFRPVCGPLSRRPQSQDVQKLRPAPKAPDSLLVFLANNFSLPAMTVAKLHKACWRIELFFKWMKQRLRIKSFLGTSPNAVKTQIWIAVSTYLLVAIVKKRLGIEPPLYTILQIPSVSLFEKTSPLQAFQRPERATGTPPSHKQLLLLE